MLKNKFKKYMPDREKIINSKSLKIFGKFLHDPYLWHLNRVSVANAFAIGMFCAWIPVPFQMALAAAGAILFHANLPLAVAGVWVTNPFTMPPLFYVAYKLGAIVLNIPPDDKFTIKLPLTMEWFTTSLKTSWQPFLLGCFLAGCICAFLGYVSMRLLWRYFTVRSWNMRKKRLATKNNQASA